MCDVITWHHMISHDMICNLINIGFEMILRENLWKGCIIPVPGVMIFSGNI